MNPATGCPLEFYREIFLSFDERNKTKEAMETQRKGAKEAASATLAAIQMAEFSNKRKSIDLEEASQNNQAKTSELTIAKPWKRRHGRSNQRLPN
jgi:hypothetical protein